MDEKVVVGNNELRLYSTRSFRNFKPRECVQNSHPIQLSLESYLLMFLIKISH
mgnify:CR=1 FL=1